LSKTSQRSGNDLICAETCCLNPGKFADDTGGRLVDPALSHEPLFGPVGVRALDDLGRILQDDILQV
jgi:hypothetical protein